jgi:hypothetical protein
LISGGRLGIVRGDLLRLLLLVLLKIHSEVRFVLILFTPVPVPVLHLRHTQVGVGALALELMLVVCPLELVFELFLLSNLGAAIFKPDLQNVKEF